MDYYVILDFSNQSFNCANLLKYIKGNNTDRRNVVSTVDISHIVLWERVDW